MSTYTKTNLIKQFAKQLIQHELGLDKGGEKIFNDEC